MSSRARERMKALPAFSTEVLALFQVMLLLLAAVHLFGEILAKRQVFTKLVSILPRRIVT